MHGAVGGHMHTLTYSFRSNGNRLCFVWGQAAWDPCAAGLGIWAVRRPTLREWSGSLARSAWVRVRHAARSTAAATGSSISGAAGAAGSAVAGAAAAATGSITQAAASVGNLAAARVAPPAGTARAAGSAAVAAVGSSLRQAAAAVRRAAAAVVPGSRSAGIAEEQAKPDQATGAAETRAPEAETGSSGTSRDSDTAAPATPGSDSRRLVRARRALARCLAGSGDPSGC